MDTDLLAMWHDINDNHFAGRLKPPVDVDWHALTEPGESLEAFAIYLPYVQSIAIDARFQFDLRLAAGGDAAENAKIEVVYRLLIHEMLHQLQYQTGAEGAGKHGQSFVLEAASVAQSMGELPPSSLEADAWPDIRPFLAAHKI